MTDLTPQPDLTPLPDIGDHRDPLAAWLTAALDVDSVEITAIAPPQSGYSAETTVLAIRYLRGGIDGEDRLILRRETPEEPVYPQQVDDVSVEIAVQYRVMDALTDRVEVPLAPLVGYDDDPAVVGAPFFVMGFVDGEVPVEDPIYTREGFFCDLEPEERATMIDAGVDVMASLHRLDWQAAGLDWLVPDGAHPGLTRQLDLWQHYAETELDGRVHERLDRTWQWLRAEQPDDTEPVLCWGDPRPGNIRWIDQTPVCVTDFEAAAIAPAGVDLGWWLMFDHWSHETMGVERLAGEPTRAEQAARYAAATGAPDQWSQDETRWYEVFAAARYCGIVVRVMNRLVARGIMPPDHDIWLHNPASDCLALYRPD